jgi:hypothetical protein
LNGCTVTPSVASAPLGVYTNPGTGRNRDAGHLAAVTRSLQWADDAAEHGDHANAIASLRAVEAIGDELSAAHRIKLHAWLLALGADRSKG